jgi:MSHA biogenesis protein MshQ
VQATGFNDNVKLELLANTGTPGTGYGSDNCPASNSLIQTIPTAAIANGRSTASFPAVAQAYRDVRVRVTYQNQTVMACSTDSFAIRPSALTLLASPIMATAPSASATPTIKAGANFTLTAATSPAAGYAGTLTLDTNKLTAQTTIQDSTEQGGGVIGTLTPVSLTANASASNNAAYTEVGYLYLAPGAYRDVTYTSVDQPNDCISSTTGDANLADSLPGGKVGCSIGNTTAVAFGRFVPHHFDVSISPNPPAFVDNCTDFTYLGQPFAWAAPPQLTIRARNSANAVTQNYEGAFWKLIDPLPFLTYVDANVPASASPLTPATSSQALPDTSNCDGIVTLALAESFNYTRPAMTSPLSPFVPAVSLSIAQARLTDTDSVCYDLGAGCQGFVVAGITGTHMRHGQVKIFNNFGPETADITHSPFEVQYYDGTKWVANSDDTCTTGLSFCPSATISAVQPVPLIPGKWTFTVSKPDSLTVCPTAPSWLTALTDCTLPNSSCGEFTFGIYRGNDRIINWQEVMR